MDRQEVVRIATEAIGIASEAAEKAYAAVQERTGATIGLAPEVGAVVIGPVAAAIVAEALRADTDVREALLEEKAKQIIAGESQLLQTGRMSSL